MAATRSDAGRRWTTRRAFAQEATLAEVMPALARRGVRALVIKGPATARLIGVAPEDRSSVDLDLMVSESSLPAASAVLESLGFRRLLAGARASEVSWSHAEDWARGHPFAVLIDLHHTLPRAQSAEAVFEALCRDAHALRIGPTQVEIPGNAGSALLLVLHAAQHAHESGRALDDLERAISTVSEATWRDAASLAGELGLMGSFAYGLRLAASGPALAERLGVSGDGTFQDRVWAASGSARVGALWIHRLRNARDLRMAASVLYDALLPSPAVMRAGQPEIGSSRMRLGVYYLRRLLGIPRSVVEYARMRDRAGE